MGTFGNPKWTAQVWLGTDGPAEGLKPYNIADPFTSDYPIVATRNTPPSPPPSFAAFCEACLRGRGIIMQKNKPGDCGVPTPLNNSTAKSISSIGNAGIAAGSAAAELAGVAATGPLAPIVAGAGLALGAITSIFTHHAQAVKTEQDTICSVQLYINPIIQAIDQEVANGSISPADGVAYMQSAVNQANIQLDTIKQSCNAACIYEAVLKAHVDFAGIYYPAIAPSNAIASPGAAPLNYGGDPVGVPNSTGVAAKAGGVSAGTIYTTPTTNYGPAQLNFAPATLAADFGVSTTVFFVGLLALVGLLIYVLARR